MHEYFSELSIAEAILSIIDSAISQCVDRSPMKSREHFADDCGWTYQILQNKFCKNGEGKYLTKTIFREMGKMLDVIKQWDEDIYQWTIKQIAYGTISKIQQLSMFIFIT